MRKNPITEVIKQSRRILHLGAVKDKRSPGQMPGTLVYVGEKRVEEVTFKIVDYSPDTLVETSSTSLEECLEKECKDTPTWIQVCGLHDTAAIGKLLNAYDIHPLVQEDVLNTRHRPKVESYKGYVYIAIRELVRGKERTELRHLSIIFTNRVVITFQEGPTDLFEPIEERFRHGKGKLRKSGPDYLAWAILDTVVDNYRLELDNFADQVDLIDDEIESSDSDFSGDGLHQLKRQVDHLYRAIRPTREIASTLRRLDSELSNPTTEIYWADLLDHTQHATESAEILRETVISLREYFLSVLSQRMNEVMKVLTSFATMFLPLTFLAGIYGMNFESMPELGWRWAYPSLWLVFIVLAALMFNFFRKKKWI